MSIKAKGQRPSASYVIWRPLGSFAIARGPQGFLLLVADYDTYEKPCKVNSIGYFVVDNPTYFNFKVSIGRQQQQQQRTQLQLLELLKALSECLTVSAPVGHQVYAARARKATAWRP